MPPGVLERIRAAIIDGSYDVTRHAVDEMADDDLLLSDDEVNKLGFVHFVDVT